MSSIGEWSWLVFTDPREDERPGRLRGGCLVRASDLDAAEREARRLGIHPGGEWMGFVLDRGMEPAEHWRERLLVGASVVEVWRDVKERHGGASKGCAAAERSEAISGQHSG